MKESVQVFRSDRRSISLQVKRTGEIVLRVPLRTTDAEIHRFLDSRKAWIEKQLNRIRQEEAGTAPPYTQEEIRHLADEALRIIPERVRHFATIVGVTYGRITIRSQKSRWGSCSAKGNLNFNCLLMDAPADVLDYVVVHELCHRKQMNHSPAFWAEVARVLPDYQNQKQWLKTEGSKLIRRMM